MKKEFKHKKTGRIAKQHETMWYSVDGYTQSAPAWIIEDPDGDWQEITKDYEILKYDKCYYPDGERNIHTVMRLSDGEIFSLKDYVRHTTDSEWAGELELIEDLGWDVRFYFSGYIARLKTIQKLRKPEKDYEIVAEINYEISSVKRLSDGEVISIDDICHYKENPNWLGKVIKIFELDGIILVRFGSYQFELNNIQKFRKPILTTEDGVELFEGDRYWFVSDENTIHTTTLDNPPSITDIYKRFSTREAAERYRLWNYRGLSIKDIIEGWVIGSHPEIVKDKLEKIVKSRLDTKNEK